VYLQDLKEGLSDFSVAYKLIKERSANDLLTVLKIKLTPKKMKQFKEFLGKFENTGKVEEYREKLNDWEKLNLLTTADIQKDPRYMKGIRRILRNML
jgi:intein/homing endonuclease